MRKLVWFVFVAACSGTNKGNPTLPTGNFAVVTTSGGFGAGGAINTVRLSDKMVISGIDTTIDQDNAVRVAGGNAYVLNRGPGTLRVYDLTTWQNPVEIQTGDAVTSHSTSNPEDLLPIAGTTRVYVSLAGNDSAHAVGVIDTAQPAAGVVKWIAVPTAANDTDGHPEPFAFYACGGKAYLLMGDYDATTFAPTGPGRIAILDPKTDTVEGFVNMTKQAPAAITAESDDCHDVLVANAGPFGLAPDGTAGIERVDLAARKSLGVVVTDTAMQGRPNSVAIKTRTLAFSSIYFDLQPQPSTGMPILSSTKVIAFDPSSGTILGDVTGKAAFIPFAALTPDGQLFVGVDPYAGSIDGGKLKAGLYTGAADGKPMGGTPIDLGQSPYAIAFK
jgi:hypothetical protein